MSTASETNDQSTEDAAPISSAARDMRQSMGAVKVSFSWFGTRRSLSDAQTRQAATQFDADVEQVSAYKKLVDTKHPAWKALTAIKGEVVYYWRGVTLPYPIEGVRLIRRDDIAAFEEKMQRFRERLADAVINLQLEFENIKARAREHLGTLYNPADYPTSVDGMFSISWEYPPVEPPRYLMTFNPELYEQEQSRIQHRFEAAVTMAEEAFAEQLSGLVNHLIERLTDEPDGTHKAFRASSVENFKEFYENFRRMNVRSNPQLESLINQANNLVSGVTPKELRTDASLRQRLSQQMIELQTAVNEVVVSAPRRRITRMN
jgi:hypothetical protein